MSLSKKIIPFALSGAIILIDQIAKCLVVKYINFYTIKYSFFNELIRIIHVRNKAIAFSIGHNFPDFIRYAIFSILPLIVLVFLIIYLIKSDEIPSLQRWFLAGIIGGGLGNLTDRFFRSGGVVDFIDIKFFGIMGLDRWPTFNIADSAIVVCSILLFISLFFCKKKELK